MLHTPPHTLWVSLRSLLGGRGLGTPAQRGFCPTSPSPTQLLASAPLQLDSNPLEAAANSAESSNLQGLHKLAFTAQCSPEKEELGSGERFAKHSTVLLTLPKRLMFTLQILRQNPPGWGRQGGCRASWLAEVRGTYGEGGTILRHRGYDSTSFVFSKF